MWNPDLLSIPLIQDWEKLRIWMFRCQKAIDPPADDSDEQARKNWASSSPLSDMTGLEMVTKEVDEGEENDRVSIHSPKSWNRTSSHGLLFTEQRLVDC
jgi:hypothetical protein